MILRNTDIRSALRSKQRGFLLNPYRFSAPATDPNFASVVLLVHFDGAHGATSATDFAPSPHTLTFSGTAALDTTQSKFGTASMATNSSNGRVTAPPSGTEFSFPGDFTWECWARGQSNSGSGSAMIGGDGTGSAFMGLNGTTGKFSMGRANVAFDLVGTTDRTNTTTFFHYAVSRTGTTLKLFVDGVEEASATNSTTYTFTTNCRIGGFDSGPSSFSWAGHIDDVRLTKGVGRYTGAFTPPTAAFPNS